MDIDSEDDDSHFHPTPKETSDLYTRFLSAVWDTFAKHSGRDLLSFRHLARTLWPRFTLPIREGTHSVKGFQKLLLAQRGLFRDETLLVPSIVSIPPPSASSAQAQPANATPSKLATRSTQITLAKPIQIVTPPLPYTSRILLVAAYLASYTPARLDTVLFSKSSALAKKRRKGLAGTAVKSRPGVEKRRKINRTLLGPQAFVVERLLAIFSAVRAEAGAERRAWGGGERGRGMGMGGAEQMQGGAADVLSAIATLASLRLLVKTSAGADVLEGSAKWKVNVGWEVVRGVGRSVGIEVGEWVVE
jgi:origin recognition complex subunit 5